MNHNSLPLLKTKNGNYICPKISIKELSKLCDEYFQIMVIENKFKENEYSPNYKILILGDKK